MNIFNKRPLGLILCVILSGFSLFVLLSPLMRAITTALAIAFIICAFALKQSTALLKIVSVSLLVSFLASFMYFDVLFYPDDLYAGENEITARVLDVNNESETYKSIEIKTLSVNSEKRKTKLMLSIYGFTDEIKPGNIISFKTEVEELRNSKSFDFKKYYTSRGISATAEITEFNVIEEGKVPLRYKFKQMRQYISEKAVAFSDEKAGSMLSALLLGERDRLSGQLTLDFARTGITHILALSGTHVVLLAAAVDRILHALKIKRNVRLITGSVFTLLFMALTGFPLSVCRAGIMLILSTVLFIATGCKDSITSLLIASTLIIGFSPYASQDVGLWLSILATGGILVAGEIFNQKYSEDTGLKKLYRYTALSFTFSLFAISATVIVSTMSFTGNSLLGAIATFVFSILTEFYVYLGIIVLLVGKFVPIGKILIFFEGVISSLVGKMSDLSFAYSSTEFPIVKLTFIVLGVSFAVFAFAKIKHRRIFIVYLSILFIFANILPVGMTKQAENQNAVIFTSEKYDEIIVKNDGSVALIDISNSSKSSAYANNSLLVEEKIVELDYYVVVNYYSSLSDNIEKVLTNNYVKEIKLPVPRSDEEHEIAKKAFNAVKEYRTECTFYKDSEGFTICGYDILVPYRIENMAAILLSRGGEIYTYISKGLLEYETESEMLLYVSDYIVFGNYGKAYTEIKTVDEYDKKLKAAVSFDARIKFEVSEYLPVSLYLPKNKFCIYP